MSGLKTRARCLLDFAIESVVEGLKGDPECYSEADLPLLVLVEFFKERPVRMVSQLSSPAMAMPG
jgi:hypothetical protein